MEPVTMMGTGAVMREVSQSKVKSIKANENKQMKAVVQHTLSAKL